LSQYLSFADDFGLAPSDEAALQIFQPLLPTDAEGNYGETSITYTARFTEEGLRSIFASTMDASDEFFIRQTMRLMVLANYLNQGPTLSARAWAYWTPGVRDEWTKGQAAFTNHSALTFQNLAPSPFNDLVRPDKVTLAQTELFQLSTLFYIEESMIKGMKKLSNLVSSGQEISPREFQKALSDFGDALKLYDSFDEGDNTIFALLDRLILRRQGTNAYRNSSLEVKSKLDGKEVTKVLVAPLPSQPVATIGGLAIDDQSLRAGTGG
jgi:hypothetical protein